MAYSDVEWSAQYLVQVVDRAVQTHVFRRISGRLLRAIEDRFYSRLHNEFAGIT